MIASILLSIPLTNKCDYCFQKLHKNEVNVDVPIIELFSTLLEISSIHNY